MDLQKLVRSKRGEILALAKRHGASNVRMFGSVPRGDSREGSDVDFLVDLAPERNLLDLIGLKLDLQDVLGVRVDVLTEGGLHPLIRDNVLAEAASV
ncbi:MAG: nucleotidyltransferase family protein [Methanobacteriota archaeon]